MASANFSSESSICQSDEEGMEVGCVSDSYSGSGRRGGENIGDGKNRAGKRKNSGSAGEMGSEEGNTTANSKRSKDMREAERVRVSIQKKTEAEEKRQEEERRKSEERKKQESEKRQSRGKENKGTTEKRGGKQEGRTTGRHRGENNGDSGRAGHDLKGHREGNGRKSVSYQGRPDGGKGGRIQNTGRIGRYNEKAIKNATTNDGYSKGGEKRRECKERG